MPKRLLKPLRKPVLGYELLVTLLVCFALSASAIMLSLRAIHETELKFCEIVVGQEQVFNDPKVPPATQTGRNSGREWTKLRNDLGCPIDQKDAGK